MRRAVSVVIILIAVLCQTTLFSYLPFYRGVKPDMVLAVVVCLGIFHSTTESLLYGIIAGVLVDAPFGMPVGLYIVIYPLAGYVSSFIAANPKLGLRSPMILCLVMSALKELVFMAYAMLNRVEPDINAAMTYALGVGMTLILMAFMYPIMRRFYYSKRMSYGVYEAG